MSLAAFTFTTRAHPFVEVGIGDSRAPGAAASWDVQHWDAPDALWSGVEPSWLDVTCDARSFRCEYGRARTTDRFVPGVASVIVDNTSGWADPRGDVMPGVLTMRPGRSIRMGIDHEVHGRRVLFRGFVDAMVPTYAPTGADTVELACLDALGEVNRAKLVPEETPTGAGDTSDVRIARILDLIAWPPSKRDLDPSSLDLIADELGGQVADLLGQAAESGGGSVFGDYDANVAYRGRDWQTYAPDVPVDGTIGNVGPDDVCPIGWERPFARADIATRVIIGRDPETAQVLDDLDAQALYGIEPFERTDLLTAADATITLLGERILVTRAADTAPRVRSVSLDGRTASNVIDLMTTVDVYRPSRYRCRLRYPRGDVFDEQMFATGVSHDVTPSSWTLELNLDAAAPYAAPGGRWDGARWDRAVWAVAP